MPRAGLRAERVVAAAAKLVETEDVRALTLARLASELGVATPSLYKHVDGLDDLVARVATLATARLADAIGAAVQGRSGADALTALARAYRGFAAEHPGLYPLTQRAPDPGSTEHAAEAQRTVAVVTAALSGYRLPEDRLVDGIRLARAAMHGFVDLELHGGFKMPNSIDRSFDVLIAAIDAALRDLASPTA
jgi:AcrR family transcriptional regulator